MDITAQRVSFTSSQTGSIERGSPDIFSLIGMSGVTSDTVAGFTYINIGSNQLINETALRIDPRVNILVSNVSDAAFVNQNGGKIMFGKTLLRQGNYFNNPLTAYINTATPALFWQPAIDEVTPRGALTVMGATSAIYWEGCVLQFTTFGAGTSGNGFQIIQA